jgi:hypothetical protein
MISHNLIFLNQLKQFQNVDITYTVLDDTYRMAIKSATSIIEDFTRRRFTRQEHTNLFNTVQNAVVYWNVYGDSTDTDDAKTRKDRYVRFDLGNIPVSQVDPISVRLDYTHVFDATSELQSDEYYIDHDKGLLFVKKPMVSGSRSLRAVYTAGYASETIATETALGNSIPDDLRMAALLVSSQVAAKLNNPNCDGDMSAKSCMNAVSYQILQKYKRMI